MTIGYGLTLNSLTGDSQLGQFQLVTAVVTLSRALVGGVGICQFTFARAWNQVQS